MEAERCVAHVANSWLRVNRNCDGWSWVFVWHRMSSRAESASPNPHEYTVRVYVIAPQSGGPERTLTRPGTIHAFQYADL